MSTSDNSVGGIGFVGLLCITFIMLKLTHCIDWSWWWILFPLWVPLAILLLIILTVASFAFFGMGKSRKQPKKTNKRKTTN